jgi:hypothetical protein
MAPYPSVVPERPHVVLDHLSMPRHPAAIASTMVSQAFRWLNIRDSNQSVPAISEQTRSTELNMVPPANSSVANDRLAASASPCPHASVIKIGK